MTEKSSQVQSISDNVWKVNADSNVYLIKLDEWIIIDTGRKRNKDIVLELSKICDFAKIKKVILTHFHYDHTGNIDLFPNAEFFSSQEEIAGFEEDPLDAVLNGATVELVNKIKLKNIDSLSLKEFEIIHTPFHTKGSFCIWYPEKKILFSGDTMFRQGVYGRTDLPTSIPEKQDESLKKLEGLDYEILCPGHDY